MGWAADGASAATITPASTLDSTRAFASAVGVEASEVALATGPVDAWLEADVAVEAAGARRQPK
jgi:hypothetical protein